MMQCTHTEFPSWYPLFSRHSIKSVIIPLPARFVSYLEADGIVLPEAIDRGAIGEDRLSDEDEEGDGGVWRPRRRQEHGPGNAEAASSAPAPFEELDAAIRVAMDQLGGKVMVKLNDKAPVDALWMNGGTMMCDSLASIYLLLKASDKVASAIRNPSVSLTESSQRDGGNAPRPDNYLVLRKWAQLHPSMEFRCFVGRGALIGICQRDCSVHYSFLFSERHRIGVVIAEFFNREVLGKLPCESVVIDVYVDKRDRVWIIGLSDFNAGHTDALLYSWEELVDLSAAGQHASAGDEEEALVPFRVVSSPRDALPRDVSLGSSRGPSDLHLMNDSMFSRSSGLLARNRRGSSSSSDDD